MAREPANQQEDDPSRGSTSPWIPGEMPLHDVYATERDYQIAGRFVITAQGTNSPLVDIVLGDCFANHLHKRSNFPNDNGDAALQHYLASLNALPGDT